MPPQPDSASAELEAYYDWNVQDQPVAVSINLNLIELLSLEIIEGFKSIPKRGLEIGGLLLGRVDAVENEPLVIIEDRELFHSEHLHGPSFLLSPHDRAEWTELTTRWGADTNKGFHAVGLFRSDTRAEHGFNAEDSSLARELFQNEVGIFLLIKPSPGGASRATVGILRDGALQSSGEFPFQSAALHDGTYPNSTRTVTPFAAERRAPLRREVTEDRTATEEGSKLRAMPNGRPVRRLREGSVSSAILSMSHVSSSPVRWRTVTKLWWIPLIAVVAILTAAIWMSHITASRQPAMLSAATSDALESASSGSPLALAVEHVGRELKLTWNHESEAIRQTTYGALEIQDGPVNHELRLPRAELLTGSINYVPESGDVKFALQLYGPDRSAAESIRSLDPAYKGVAAPRSSSRVSSKERSQRSSRSKPEIKPPSEEQIAASPAATLPSVVQTKPAEQTAVAPPPPQASPSPAHSSEDAQPARAETRPPASVTASFEPVGPSRLHKALSRMSPTRLVRGHEDIVPASPIHEVAPRTTPQLLRGIREPVSVDVRVAIDKHGLVTDASVEDLETGAPLPNAAMAAARNWKFTPAHKGSNPVASQAVLHFRFQNPEVVVQADRQGSK